MELIVAMVGMASLALVAWMGRYFEHLRWERDARLKGYSEFLTACDKLKSAISATVWDDDLVKQAQADAAEAWRTMSLLASGATAIKGRIYLAAMLTSGAISEPKFNLPDEVRQRIAHEFQNERMAFIAAARKDLSVKPAVLPKPSLEELRRASETKA